MVLDLLDWRRTVAGQFRDVCRDSPTDGAGALARFREAKDRLFASHRQSPIPETRRATFGGLDYWPYDPALRFDVVVEPLTELLADVADLDADTDAVAPSSTGEAMPMHPVGTVTFPFGTLTVYWIDVYGGGIFLPLRDATSGTTTYGGGRYLLDTVKGADLGGEGDRLIVDFNYAYHPSCSYDPRWSCPLAPRSNTLAVAIEAGERMNPNGYAGQISLASAS